MGKTNLDKFRYSPNGLSKSETKKCPTSAHKPPLPLEKGGIVRGTIPPILEPNLLVVFIGFNPGIKSGITGHHYAHHSNRFWKFLFESGLTEEKFDSSRDVDLPKLYGYGFTDLVARSTVGITSLSRQEKLDGAASLELRIRKYSPKFIVFIGKGIWDIVCIYKGHPTKKFEYGLQPVTFGNARAVVFPSTSGLVSINKDVQLGYWTALKALVDEERENMHAQPIKLE